MRGLQDSMNGPYMGIKSNTVHRYMPIYSPPVSDWNSSEHLLKRGVLVPLHIGINPQTQRQLLTGVQLDQRFQNLGIYVFRRFVRPDILFLQNVSHTNHMAPEFRLRPCQGPESELGWSRFEFLPYFFTAMACNSKCPPRRSDPAPMNSRAG